MSLGDGEHRCTPKVAFVLIIRLFWALNDREPMAEYKVDHPSYNRPYVTVFQSARNVHKRYVYGRTARTDLVPTSSPPKVWVIELDLGSGRSGNHTCRFVPTYAHISKYIANEFTCSSEKPCTYVRTNVQA